MPDSPITEAVSCDGTEGDTFLAGIRILVVDDDELALTVIQKVLSKCKYEVVAVNRATDALNILHERKGGFDLILADVHMPIMDGFELLAIVRKDFEIPVIMVSADSELDLMAKGLQSGACSFCVKPVTKNYAETLWQFVFYKTRIHQQKLVEEEFGSVKQVSLKKEGVEYSSSVNVRSMRQHDRRSKEKGKKADVVECSSSVNVRSREHDKRSKGKGKEYEDEEEEEEEEEEEDDEESDEERVPPKKSRMVWTPSLHEKFVSAVKQIGVKKAVPKKILDVMNVRGVSRTNIASHLQKYRLYLKGNKESSQYGSKIWDRYNPASYGLGLSQVCDQGGLSDYPPSRAKYGQPSRTILSQRNIQRQVMSTRMNMGQQCLTSVPSVESSSFRNPVYQQGLTNFPSAENSGFRNLVDQQGLTYLPSAENSGFRNLADQQGLTNFPSAENSGFRNLEDQQGLTNIPYVENSGFRNLAYQQGLTNLPSSIEDPGFGNPVNDASSYETNYVGLKLYGRGGMVGLRQTGLNGGATSHTMISSNMNEGMVGLGQIGFNGGATSHIMTSNSMNESYTGKRSRELFETPVNVPNFDARNTNQVTEVAPISDIYVNPDIFQATATVPVAEPQQQAEQQQEGVGLDCWSELLTNNPTNDLSYLLSNVQYPQQEQGIEGLIMDPQFDVGELQFDDNYQPHMQAQP